MGYLENWWVYIESLHSSHQQTHSLSYSQFHLKRILRKDVSLNIFAFHTSSLAPSTRFKIQTLKWIPDPKQAAQSPRGRHSFHHLQRDRHRVLLSQPVVTPANNDSSDNCPKSRPNPRGRKISSPSPTISTSTLSSPGSSNPKS